MLGIRFSFLFSTFFILLYSCSERKKSNIELDELIKPSTYIEKEVQSEFSNNWKLSSFSKRLLDALDFPIDSIIELKNNELGDRFTSDQKEKWKAFFKSDFFFFKHWKYRDTNISENVWFNQLDFFGKKLGGLEMGDNRKISPNSIVLLLQYKSLVFIETSRKIELESFIKLCDTLGFGSTWKYVLFQPKNGKTKWFSVSVKDSINTWRNTGGI